MSQITEQQQPVREWAVVCSFLDDEGNLQDDHEQQVKSIVAGIEFTSKSATRMIQQPGCTIITPAAHQEHTTSTCIHVDEQLMAVFSGNIENYGYIVKKFFLLDLGLNNDSSITLQKLSKTKPIKSSTLICKLFRKLGTSFMAKLRGEFEFCIFDCQQLRVLAATSPTGSVRLYQHTSPSKGIALLIGAHLTGCSPESIIPIPPGNFKYGHNGEIMKYACTEVEVLKSAEQASAAARDALSGIVPETPVSQPSNISRQRMSFDSHGLHARRQHRDPWAAQGEVSNIPMEGRNSFSGQRRSFNGPRRNSRELRYPPGVACNTNEGQTERWGHDKWSEQHNGEGVRWTQRENNGAKIRGSIDVDRRYVLQHSGGGDHSVSGGVKQGSMRADAPEFKSVGAQYIYSVGGVGVAQSGSVSGIDQAGKSSLYTITSDADVTSYGERAQQKGGGRGSADRSSNSSAGKDGGESGAKGSTAAGQSNGTKDDVQGNDAKHSEDSVKKHGSGVEKTNGQAEQLQIQATNLYKTTAVTDQMAKNMSLADNGIQGNGQVEQQYPSAKDHGSPELGSAPHTEQGTPSTPAQRATGAGSSKSVAYLKQQGSIKSHPIDFEVSDSILEDEGAANSDVRQLALIQE